ncbi:MAG: 3-phenylpropionate/cinnamic acid dioxygenase subunit beta [bacterium]
MPEQSNTEPSNTELSTPDLMLLQFEVEQFLYHEAKLLDERRYDEWINLLTEDIHYWMPIRRTTTTREINKEFTEPGAMAFFDDDLEMLKMRVKKMAAGNAWSEDPPSRTRHFVSNIHISGVQGDEIKVELNFHLYRTRLESEEDSWIGRRQDLIRRTDNSFMLARRHIFLEQTVILSQNMSSMF